MLVENQPAKPKQRVRSIGASTVFISVCPVLKSFPAMGNCLASAISHIAGISIHVFGAPITKGASSAIAA